MSRLIFLAFLLFVSFEIPAQAADVGIIPLPRDMDNLTIENFIEGVQTGRDAGATATLAAPNWREMEPSKEKYDFEKPLGGSAYSVAQGMDRLYLNIQLINTVKRELPKDLAQVSWDDPVLLVRFDSLMAAIKEKGGIQPLAVSIGNEIDTYFSGNLDEVDAYIKFLNMAKPIVKKYYSDVPVGVTVTYEGLEKGREDIIRKLSGVSEILFFTYYPLIDFKPLSFSDIPAHLAKMQAMAGGKDIVIQEIGFPSGSKAGSNEKMQAEFFEKALPVFMKSPQIKAIFIFALHDISPKICESLIGYYGATSWPENYKEGFRDFLCYLGLKDSKGNSKPAFEVVKKIFKQ